MPTNLADAPWLLRKFAIAHVPAPSNFVSLRKIAGGSRATQPWFGFGDFQPVTLAQAQAAFPGPACARKRPAARRPADAALCAARSWRRRGSCSARSASDELLGRGLHRAGGA